MTIEDTRITELVEATKSETGGLAVIDEDSYALAGGILTKIAGRVKEIEALRKPNIDSANKLHKALVGALKKDLEPFAAWDKELRVSMMSYRSEQAQRQREAQAKADAEAQRLAEERRKLLLEEAAALAEPEEIAAIAAAPIVFDKVVQWQPPAAKVAGISTKILWKHRVVDPLLVPRQFLAVDEKALAKYATDNHEKAVVPGVEFYPDEVMNVRA